MAISFNGKYLIKIQAKSQVVLPSKLREDENSSDFPNTFYLMHESFIGESAVADGQHLSRIIMYPLKEWGIVIEKIEEKLRLGGAKDAGRQIRLLRSSVERVELDPQNRFTLKKELLDRAQISDKEVYFIGNGTKIEIWDKQAFDAYSAAYEDSIRETFKNFSEDF